MAFSWNDFKNNVGDTLVDFKNQTVKMTGLGNNTDNIDEAIEDLTNESYSQVYTSYNNIKNSTLTSNNVDGDFIPAANISKTGTTEYGSWDPRLSRVDAFLSKTTDGGGNPIIVPFSSASAAGAFYDLVFHIEASVAQDIKKSKNYNSNIESTISGGEISLQIAKKGETISETQNNEVYRGSEHVLMGSKTLLDNIRSRGDNYGIASIVNPYTLTKLCGGLILTSKDAQNNINIENRLYDIRDSRRFYDKSVADENDVLSITNPTTTNIITYSNRDPWGRTPYFFQDFVFCKYWNIIPNNRLITLRKYHAPVYDNLQFANMYKGNQPDKIVFAPIATVVTYFGDDTGNTLQSLTSFTTGVKWREINANIYDVNGEAGSNPRALIDQMFSNGSGFNGATSELGQTIQNAGNFITSKLISLGKFVGLMSPNGFDIKNDQDIVNKFNQANVDPTANLYNNKIIGPVNRIDSTKARDAGIIFEHRLSLTCQYVARPIGGVNTKAAMLDILSNCLEIASVDAMFWGGGYKFMIMPQTYPFKGMPFSNKIMDDLYKGKIFGKDGALAHTVEGVKNIGTDTNGNFSWDNIINNVGKVLGQTLGALGEMLNSITNVLFGDSNTISKWLNNTGAALAGENNTENFQNDNKNRVNNFFKNLNEMWRSDVIQKSVMPTVTGMKAILTGEPVGNWHLTVGNPLNPIMVIGNLICTDMKFEFSEELGPDDFPLELKVVYNLEHGMARDKGSIQSIFNRGNGKIYELPDYIRASSDYETKVDKYTGPSTNGGWYTPKFLGATNLGASGYKTYKISPPKDLAMNTYTDNVFIAKFTPVDVDAAVSNIKNDGTFFNEYEHSRAIIRGTAMTRKFIN